MKKYLRALEAVLLFGAVLFALWYTRPMTIAEICPAIDFDECSRIHGYYYLYDGSNGAGDEQRFELTADDAEFTALLASVKERKFRRSLLSLLPSGGRSHRLEDGDYKWNVIFTFNDLSFPDAIPRIVSDELFDEVQEIRSGRTHGHRSAIEDYILTGKLYCGHCMDLMMGTSGTSRHKQTYRYYTCSNAPKNCNKKNVRKDLLEERIIQTCRNLLSDAVIEKVKRAVIEQNRIDEESAELIRLREEIKTTEGRIDKLLDQIEDGLNSIRAAERLQQREQELSELKRQLKREESKQVKLDPKRIVEYLTIVRDGSIDNIQYKKMLVNTLIDRIYLYDDHFLIMLNYSGRKGKLNSREAADIVEYFDDPGGSVSNITGGGLPRKTA